MNPLGLREKCMWHRGSSKYLIPTCDIKDFQKFLVISEPAFWIIWIFSSSPLVYLVFEALCWLLFFFHSFTHSFIKSILVTYLQYAHHYWPVLCPKSPLAFRNMTLLLFIQTLPKIRGFLFFIFLPQLFYQRRQSLRSEINSNDGNFNVVLLILNSLKIGIISCSSFKPNSSMEWMFGR